MGNAQERLDAIERPLPHCEVLLHSAFTLSLIVAHGKLSHICGEVFEAASSNRIHVENR